MILLVFCLFIGSICCNKHAFYKSSVLFLWAKHVHIAEGSSSHRLEVIQVLVILLGLLFFDISKAIRFLWH